MQKEDAVSKAYQGIFKALSGYGKDVSRSYQGGIVELAKRLDQYQDDVSGKSIPKGDFLSMIKDGQGELANWKTDTRMQMIRDIESVVDQFPELELAANTALEAMCDGDTVSGGMKLAIQCRDGDIDAEALIEKLERKYNIRYHLRNTVFKNTLKHGEYYILIRNISSILNYTASHQDQMTESVSLLESIRMEYKKENPKSVQPAPQMMLLYETAKSILDETNSNTNNTNSDIIGIRNAVDSIVNNITIHESYEQLFQELYQFEGAEYIAKEHGIKLSRNGVNNNLFEGIIDGYSEFPNGDVQDTTKFDKIKGCYIKWLNATQVLPIRVGTVVIGYYYIHYANTNISNKTSFASGIVDVSQTTSLSSSRDFMQQLANVIAQNLSVKFVQKNIDLIDDITSILIENQFRKKSVSFTFIPKDDIVPFKINIDTDGNGNSMFSRSIFNARLYSMLLMTNIVTILNNRPTRTYKVKRDPRTSNIASTIQQFKEKIYSKRIGIDDIWSYNGAMNKIGSPNDMVIPVDADGTPPFTKEYDQGAEIPLNTELMEMAKKAAISLTGVPNAMINQQDEIEYSKLAQMAQLKLLDFVKNLKIDFNTSTTLLYRRLLQMEFRLTDEQVDAIRVTIPDVRSNDINIISEMLQTFNTIFDVLVSVLLTTEEAQTPDGKPSTLVKQLKYAIMKEMVPALDYARLEQLKKQTGIEAEGDDLKDQVRAYSDFSDDEAAEEVGGMSQ